MTRFAESSVPSRRGWRVLALVLLCMFASLAQAQSGADDSADPPTRVARLSYIGGDLGFLPAGAKAWSDANINRPLTTGDKLSSAADARAELEFDGGTLRIDGETDLGLLDLNDRLAQIELTEGSLSLSVRQLGDGESYEIDTPAVALVVDQPGTFRVDVDPRDGSTRVAALDGAATVFGENNAQRSINPGRSYRFADASLNMVTISDINGGDAFDRWASGRDRRYAQSDSSQYVSERVVGYQDLDQYGGWQDSSEYGAVWYPRNVGADWAPYRDGHWAYIAPWGWTWIDDAPWGYAPYHYGRWAYTQRGWGWIPGPRGGRAVYAPALVAFVGGGGWSVGIGGAPVGWFPLGPGEIYNPWYGCGRRCYTSVNVYNIRVRGGHDPRRDIDDHYNRYRRGDFNREARYANGQAPRGFTAVSGSNFAGGQRVQRHLLHVDPRKLTDLPARAHDIDRLRPIDGGDRSPRTSHVRNLPAGGFNRTVVARRAPPDLHDNPMPQRAAMTGAPARERVRVLGDAGQDQRPSMADREGRNGRRDNPMPQRAAMTGAPTRERVRVLGDAGQDQRPAMADREGRNGRRADISSTPLPVVPRITPADRSPSADTARGDGELRSARFAHPRGRDGDARVETMPRGRDGDARAGGMPRPGVSYISPASPPPPARDPTPRSMPQAPPDHSQPETFDRGRFQREAAQQPAFTAPARNATEPRFERPQPRFEQPQPRFEQPQPRFEQPQPRFQRAQPTQRDDVQQAPQPVSQRNEPAPQRYQPPQRAAPAPPAQAPRPQENAVQPAERKHINRSAQDDQR